MSSRQILPLAAVLFASLPASALAAPTVTVTGDDGNPAPLNAAAPISIRNVSVTVGVSVPTTDARNYTVQVVDGAGTGVTTLSGCNDTRYTTLTRGFPDYRGNGTYTVLLRYYAVADTSCTRTPTGQVSLKYTVSAGTAVTGPPGRVLTRAPNSFATNTYQFPVALNPGLPSYEVRYARGGVPAADGSISGPSALTFLDTRTGLADFRFDKPGRWLIEARVQSGSFFTPWSAPVYVNAVAPFDLERTSFPDARGPRYKVRGQIRELAARGKVKIAIAKGRKKGKFHGLGSAKINSKGRFTKRFTVRRTGTYRLRYSYKGSSLVAGGRVTEAIKIRRRIFFG